MPTRWWRTSAFESAITLAYDDSQIDSFRLRADNVHAYGAKLGVQLFHPEYDVDALNALFDNGEMVKVRAQLHHDMQHFVNEVTEGALMQIIEKMCACAVRAHKAGVDVIQVHGDKLVGDVGSTVLPTMLENYRTHGVKQYAGHKVTNISLGELSCEDAAKGS